MKKIIGEVKRFFTDGFYRWNVMQDVKRKIISMPGIKQIHAWVKSKN